MSADPYGVLGVADDAPQEQVRAAYLRLARRHHPDFYASADSIARAGAERRMQEVNEAWELVGDPARRALHDAARRLGPGAVRPDPGFRPFDTAGDGDPDPLTQPDVPYRREAPRASARRRAVTLVPVALLVAAVVAAAFGLLLVSAPALGLAGSLLLLSFVGFLAVPLLEMGRATRDEG